MISLIFGAGASFGSDSTSTPPLGNDLFASLNSLGGAFYELADESKKIFLDEGFESGMGALANDSSIINPLQNELAIYLSSFSVSNENAYCRLFHDNRRYMRYLFLLTLNYDLLIEHSLTKCGLNPVGYDINNLSTPSRLMKLHGSSNFVPDLGSNSISGTFINCGTFVETQSIKYLNGHGAIKEWCSQNTVLSPVMCMYNKEKRAVFNSNYVESLKELYKGVISRSNAIVIIGVKYIPHDNHVWDSILQGGAFLLLVDPYPDNQFLRLLRKRRIQHRIIKKSFMFAVDDISTFIHSKLKHKH
ncbi:hypothetical protein R4I72_18210 [Leclercia adecarboxylata]|uniref:hypothetical protein n=1 Tax=Leclercia adecarboxylata TaxID=83655 RepID=UPI0027CDE6F0|nr:hypothetical protein [Leclercia adecarboxylata]MDQ2130612.1 hypothetical protein [Leclercia adecarboxylata]MDV7058970.1 hypothetical protein [Leclercia adecarboxylata]